jgi:hypothetical protein
MSGVRFIEAAGHLLRKVQDGEVHLVFAVDSFPYIVNAGERMVGATLAEMRRVLRPDGDILLFNYSYRGDEDLDRSDVARHARAAGLALVAWEAHPFKSWDGSLAHLRLLA